MSVNSRKFFRIGAVPIFMVFILYSTTYAEKEHGGEERGYKMGHHGKMKGQAAHKKGHRKGKHIFGGFWKNTLTDEQKKKIDRMHLNVMKNTTILKTKIDLKKTELNSIVISDSPKTSDINKKIKEVVSLKQKVMKIKYAHMVDMRKILTDEQKVSFDMGILTMKGIE